MCEVPREIDECCTVTDALALMLGKAVNRLKENLKVVSWDCKLKAVKLNKPPACKRATDIDDTPDSYEDISTPVFTKIIDGVQEYLRHWFKNLQAKPLTFYFITLQNGQT